MSLKPIENLDELVNYLHAAIQLEHATIPPYLTALYTIVPGTNSEAVRLIRAVLVEEMLHLTLASNVLNAVGGTPDLTQPGFVPAYPTHLPDGETDFAVSRQRFSREAVKAFLKIERPARAPSKQSHVKRKRRAGKVLVAAAPRPGTDMHFYSIGEFYHEISRGLNLLHAERSKRGKKLFTGDPARQVTPEYYYSGGGEIIPVTDLASAQAALRLIMEQGEGYEGGIFDYEGEISHYYRFQQILLGRYYVEGDKADKPSGRQFEVDWDAVYPAQTDVHLSDYPKGSELHTAAHEFNAFYYEFLCKLTMAYSGRPEMLMAAVGDMFRIKGLATDLIRNPIPGKKGVNAAPTFELDAIAAAGAPAVRAAGGKK
jgi:hypothetical protein